jgi:hypothetical protein
MKVSQAEIEKHRKFWAKIAKANNWYTEPFHVQVWIDKGGNVTDSVSHISLTKDIVIEE